MDIIRQMQAYFAQP